jgi:hypothetical protein
MVLDLWLKVLLEKLKITFEWDKDDVKQTTKQFLNKLIEYLLDVVFFVVELPNFDLNFFFY